MQLGTLSALHSTQEGWEGGTLAKDLYLHKQERPVSQLGRGHLVDRAQAGDGRCLQSDSWICHFLAGCPRAGDFPWPSLCFLISRVGGLVILVPWTHTFLGHTFPIDVP